MVPKNLYNPVLSILFSFLFILFSFSHLLASSIPLRVLQPNGGEVLNAGQEYLIRWEAPRESHRFLLRLSTDNKATWTNIATVSPSNACTISGNRYICQFRWRVPPQDDRKYLSYIRIIAYDSSGRAIRTDDSDGYFIIEVLRLIRPNGGEVLREGSTYTITWQTYALTWSPTFYVLQYKDENDGGIYEGWRLITIGRGNPGQFTWRVPTDARCNRCLVRITLVHLDGYGILNPDVSTLFRLGHFVSDESDNVFYIVK